VVDDRVQLCGAQRLRDNAVCASFQECGDVIIQGVAGQTDDQARKTIFADLPRSFGAILKELEKSGKSSEIDDV
jgi:hypothetical protein